MAEDLGQDRPPAGDEDVRSTLATLVELLTRSVMLPSDRLRETLDDAVRRGRMTRGDADDLVDRLVASGRTQTEELLGRLERLTGAPARAATGAGERARNVARLTAGTDRVLREVDRARRAAGLGTAFPVIGYDDLTAAQVIARLAELGPAELREVREHEKRNANRKSVLGAVDRRLRDA
jgi:polyhydroxyalkanoate synthesis regulator phasin